MKKVVKFGGSSLASAEQFKKVGNIIRAEESRRYVVPSAPGKRFSADTKVTDMLYGCYAAAENGEDFTEKLAAIKDRYQEIIDGLGLKFSLDEDFEVIRKNFSEKAGSNYAASRGEFLNGKIMAAYLGFEFIDAAEVVRFDENGDFIVPDDYKLTITVSYDEKPGIQAISNTAPDLRPTSEHGEVYRDAEYKRLGTLSLLAGIDLLTGEAIPLVSETHKSSDFIEFLKILDKKYPSQDTIRIILDNHSAHTSKETRRFLDTMPKGRFKFVFTPKHGSWLNMIESFFNKMTRQMLRGIRVNTKQELEERIYKYFDEVNREPVVYHWKYKMDEISEEEAVSI